MSASPRRVRIEWTEQTWNPVIGGAKVSPGCPHGYTESMAHRLQALGAPGDDRGFALNVHGRLGRGGGAPQPEN